ncbi:MAG: alkaline phosphatase [Gammaproteobacteria bacterium]|nr:alkaline phosphatase [Gammaproteobacteria bacterium]
MAFNRRTFLRQGMHVTTLLAASTLSASALGATRLARVTANPFYLGVASGDPRPDSVVIWTRLARETLGNALSRNEPVAVDYEIAETANFSTIYRKGSAAALPELGYSVHLDLQGLNPGKEYYYRWMLGGEVSNVGRTKTAPALDATTESFRFGFASCQQYEHGYFTALDHMAKERFDLIVHLGDYIYEETWGANNVRHHNAPEIYTLDDYRARYELYKQDLDLQAAHASAPWAVTWDDHEVDDNYANAIAVDEQTPKQLLIRRAAAYQAFYEFMPIRLPSGRQGASMQIYRPLQFGTLMDMIILDTRQYRNDQACGDGMKPSCDQHREPNRTLLGEAQKDWLFKRLRTSDATWNVMAQQVMMGRLLRRNEQEEEMFLMDIWDGYPDERDELLARLKAARTPNPIVLTGDIHSNWVNNILSDFSNERSEVIATEFVGTSITSGGDGSDASNTAAQTLSDNSHVKFYNRQRGYVSCHLSKDLWQSDYKILDKVSEPGHPIRTRASFVVEAGNPGALEA